MKRRSLMASVVAIGWTAAAIAGAGSATPEPAPTPAPAPAKACAAAEYRQFDFWLGGWNVTNPKGQPAGTNEITLEQDGCVLHEHWTGAKGGTGQSFNIYDATDKRWHQVWVDNQGSLLQLQGGLVDGRMVLEGPGRGPGGAPVVNRIAWEKLADGRVRQTWTVSKDGGTTWTVSFDGFYSKK